jgi:WD40 repeat protein
VWDAAGGAEVLVIRHPEPVFNAEWSPEGSKILTVARGPGVDVEFSYFHARAYVWEADSGRQLLRKAVDDFPYDGEEPHLRPVTWSGDGRRIACVVFKGVTVWDVETGRGVSSPTTWGDLAKRDVGTPTGLALNREGTLLTTYNPGGVALWDTTKRDRLLDTLARGESVQEVVFTRDAHRFFVSVETPSDETPFNSTGVWDAASRRLVLPIRPQGKNSGGSPAAAFSPDGKRVAAGFASDGFTSIWEVPDHKQP